MSNKKSNAYGKVKGAILDYMINHISRVRQCEIEEGTKTETRPEGFTRGAVGKQIRKLIDKDRVLEWEMVGDRRSIYLSIRKDVMARSWIAEHYIRSSDKDRMINYLKSKAAKEFIDDFAVAAVCTRIVNCYPFTYRRRMSKHIELFDRGIAFAKEDGESPEFIQLMEEARKARGDTTELDDMGVYTQFSNDTQLWAIHHFQTRKGIREIKRGLKKLYGFTNRDIEELKYMLRWSPSFLQFALDREEAARTQLLVSGPMSAKGYDSEALQQFVKKLGRVSRSKREVMRAYLFDFFQTWFNTSMLDGHMKEAAQKDREGLFRRLWTED